MRWRRAAHTALFKRDKRGGPTTSLIACPAERQGQLLVARAAELLGDHVDQRSQSRVVLKNGAQIIALPMSNDAGATARGYTVSGILICDEFGFLPNAEEVLAVVSPMTTIHGADMMLISSASYDGDLWHSIIIEEQGNWSRYKIAVEDCPRLTPDVLDDLRGQLGPALYAREMLNQFSVSGFSPVDLHAARAAALDDPIGIDLDVLMGAA